MSKVFLTNIKHLTIPTVHDTCNVAIIKGIYFISEALNTTIRLEGDGDEIDPWSIRLIDRSYIKALSIQVRSILLQEENSGGKMEIGAFKEKFQKRSVSLSYVAAVITRSVNTIE